jgi:acyl carrier protein
MEPEVLLDKIREAISRELEIPTSSLTEDASLRNQYGLDSVAAVNIVFTLETQLDIAIDIRKLATVDSIAELRNLLYSGILRRG